MKTKIQGELLGKSKRECPGVKYYNPNKVVKNSRKGVNIGGKQFFKEKDVRLAMCECNLIFYKLNLLSK